MQELAQLSQELINGNGKVVAEGVRRALDEGVDPGAILEEGLVAGMKTVGDLFKECEIFLPEVMLAAKAMNAGMDLLEPHLAKSESSRGERVAIGTVQGDLHDIGKNLVAIMLRGAGFRVENLGADVPPERFVASVKDRGARLVCLSALLTSTLSSMRRTVDALREAGLRERVKVMVGGAPVTPELAKEIGADGYGKDAAEAVDKARELLGFA